MTRLPFRGRGRVVYPGLRDDKKNETNADHSRLPFSVSGSAHREHAADDLKILEHDLDAEVAEHLDALPEWLQVELLRGWLSAHGVTV